MPANMALLDAQKTETSDASTRWTNKISTFAPFETRPRQAVMLIDDRAR
jgi:hypothetical protein